MVSSKRNARFCIKQRAGKIKQLATFACGNVRQALLDADAALSGQAHFLAL